MSTVATSQMMLFPADQGTRVRPSGRFLFERERLVNSIVDGILALTRANRVKNALTIVLLHD